MNFTPEQWGVIAMAVSVAVWLGRLSAQTRRNTDDIHQIFKELRDLLTSARNGGKT